jgi:hypothetical protein
MLARRLAATALISLMALGCGTAAAQDEPPEPAPKDELVEEVPAEAAQEQAAALQRKVEELAARRAELISRHRVGRAQAVAGWTKLETALENLRRGEIELNRERTRIEQRIARRRKESGLGENALEMGELRAQLEETVARRKEMADQVAAHEAELADARDRLAVDAARTEATMADVEAELTRVRHQFALLHPERFPRGERRHGERGPFGPRGPGPRGPGPRGRPDGERGPPPRHGPGGPDHADRPFRSGSREGDRIDRLERAVSALHEMLARHGFDGEARSRGEDTARRRFDRRPGPPAPRADPRRRRGGERRPAPPSPGRQRGLPGLIEHLDDMTRRVDEGGEIHTPDQVERLRASMQRFMETMQRRRAADEVGRPERDR